MNTLIGLLIIAIGSFGQSSSYVPINKVKGWSWESFWLIQGVFAWLVFPLLGALLAIPAGSNLIELWGTGGALPAIVYGVLWGVGGLTFGLSMRYLGCRFGAKYRFGHLCRFWNSVSCFVCRKGFVAWRRVDAPYWCLYYFGGNCGYWLCRQFALQEYE